jgi:hypothetical protein
MIEQQRGQDRLSWFTAALILMWTGVVLSLQSTGLVYGPDGEQAGAIVFIGAGVLLWIEALVRLAVPGRQRAIEERVILGMVFVIVGLSELTQVNVWPLLIVGIGIALLLAVAVAPRRS